MSNPVRMAVVGVGHLGRHHARKIMASSRAVLVALIDLDKDRATAVAEELDANVRIEQDLSAIAGELDAVVIAASTGAHHALAITAAGLGLHALIEKPIAPTPTQAQAIVDAMRDAGCVLQVGHTERFNPASSE